MAKVLVDTSVWIEFYHPQGSSLLAALSHQYEVWHFSDHHFATIAEASGPPERDLW